MWYEVEANFMRQMVKYTVPNAQIKANRDAVRHQYIFTPAPQVFPEVLIYYPGKKEIGDYKLTFFEKELKHSQLCDAIFSYCTHGQDYIKWMSIILEEIYHKGLNATIPPGFHISICGEILNFEQFKTLLYWITLQEEINYPLSNNKMSLKLPFSRYCESIFAAHTKQNTFSIVQIKRRADSRSRLKVLEKLSLPRWMSIPNELNQLYNSIR